MGQIRVFFVHHDRRHRKADWNPKNPSRPALGFTVQAVSSPNRRACRFCGAPMKAHRARDCGTPVRRGWGYPGWENEDPDRQALVATGSPSKKKQRRMAFLAAARSSTGVHMPKSKPSKPSRVRTSGGTPAKPQ